VRPRTRISFAASYRPVTVTRLQATGSAAGANGAGGLLAASSMRVLISLRV
jgi:hypothetical protein